MKIEDINKLEIPERIKELKKRQTKAPDTLKNLADWDFEKHDVMSAEIRKKRKVMVKDAVENADHSIKEPAQFKEEEVNRIALPLEQDIVNIHTAFTVGTEPSITLESEDAQEQELLKILQKIFKQNKIKYNNKRAVRSWLSECEVAEYWYVEESDTWWNKILKAVGIKNSSKQKLRSVLWSPFRGDKLYPYYNEFGDLIVFSREYTAKVNGKDVEKFMTIDSKTVTIYADNVIENQFAHGFEKIPVIYMYRPKPLCYKIKTIRNRLETLLSNYADCLDYNFFPKLMASGVIQDIQNRGQAGSEIIELAEGGKVAYLTWQQSPEMAKLEFENLTERAYSLTNTPRISFEALKGTGNALSGRAFKYMFMGTHLEVSNHAEIVEEFLQRRVNFIVHAIGLTLPKYKNTSELIDIETEIVPYMIDSQTEQINDAVIALGGGVASLETGIIMAGITDRIKEEREQIESSKQHDVFQPSN